VDSQSRELLNGARGFDHLAQSGTIGFRGEIIGKNRPLVGLEGEPDGGFGCLLPESRRRRGRGRRRATKTLLFFVIEPKAKAIAKGRKRPLGGIGLSRFERLLMGLVGAAIA
jgi:hypothetical protein